MGHDKGHEDSLLVYFLFVAIPPGLIFGALMCLKHWLLPFKPANAVKALPSGVQPLSPSEAAVVTEALQGEWAITGPGGLEARVTGLVYVCGGRPQSQGLSLQHAATCNFKLSKLPATGQIYLDNSGTTCVTEGWPHNRPMAGQVGEIMDLGTASAFVRWTRSTSSPGASSATTTGSRTAQATTDMPTAHAVLDIEHVIATARAAAEIVAMQAPIAALTAAGAPPPARRVFGYGHGYGAPANPHGAPAPSAPPPPQMQQPLPVRPGGPPLCPPIPPMPPPMHPLPDPDMPPPAYGVVMTRPMDIKQESTV